MSRITAPNALAVALAPGVNPRIEEKLPVEAAEMTEAPVPYNRCVAEFVLFVLFLYVTAKRLYALPTKTLGKKQKNGSLMLSSMPRQRPSQGQAAQTEHAEP